MFERVTNLPDLKVEYLQCTMHKRANVGNGYKMQCMLIAYPVTCGTLRAHKANIAFFCFHNDRRWNLLVEASKDWRCNRQSAWGFRCKSAPV